MPTAFQDCYPEKFSHCYGCGRSNRQGHHLKSYWDGDETLARFTVRPEFSGGVPGHVFGGMVASLLDCHGTASAAAFACRAAGREMGDGGEFMRFVTASLKVDYLRPTPIGVELEIRGRLLGIEGRKVQVSLSLGAEGQACARAEMLAVQFRE
ncbi:MAG: PaaI family thioesterase [Betaproteobacteria bacterium]|nr:PaaI family thioesterase [Betaproteobacteria bacterium]